MSASNDFGPVSIHANSFDGAGANPTLGSFGATRATKEIDILATATGIPPGYLATIKIVPSGTHQFDSGIVGADGTISTFLSYIKVVDPLNPGDNTHWGNFDASFLFSSGVAAQQISVSVSAASTGTPSVPLDNPITVILEGIVTQPSADDYADADLPVTFDPGNTEPPPAKPTNLRAVRSRGKAVAVPTHAAGIIAVVVEGHSLSFEYRGDLPRSEGPFPPVAGMEVIPPAGFNDYTSPDGIYAIIANLPAGVVVSWNGVTLPVYDTALLTWNDNSSNETGFLIEFSDVSDTGPWQNARYINQTVPHLWYQDGPTLNLPPNTTTTDDQRTAISGINEAIGANADRTRWWRISAYGSNGASAWSDVASLVFRATPSDLGLQTPLPRIEILNAPYHAKGPLPSKLRLAVSITPGTNYTITGYLWEQLDGPSTAQILSPTQSDSDIVFDTFAPGLYHFRLTISGNFTNTGDPAPNVFNTLLVQVPRAGAPVVSSGRAEVLIP